MAHTYTTRKTFTAILVGTLVEGFHIRGLLTAGTSYSLNDELEKVSKVTSETVLPLAVYHPGDADAEFEDAFELEGKFFVAVAETPLGGTVLYGPFNDEHTAADFGEEFSDDAGATAVMSLKEALV
jgi:hypothetical protein